MKQPTHGLSRRHLLKGLATSRLLTLGMTPSLLRQSPLIAGVLAARQAEAQGSRPNKSVVVYIPGGGIHDLWAPSGSGEAMQMQPMSQAYDAVKTECHFLLNMAHGAAGHGRMPLLLSNAYYGSDSYDVFMGKQLGPTFPFTYLNLGVHSNGAGYLTRNGTNRIPFEDNPFTAFTLLFGGNTAPHSKTPILDAHATAVRAIKNQLAGYEVSRLDDHLEAIADTQQRLDDAAGTNSCGAAPNPSDFPLTFDRFTQQAKLQIDIAVAALSCNMTRSVSIGLGNHQSQFRIPELRYQGSYHQSIHGGSNGQANYPYYTEMRNHLGSLTAYLIERLQATGQLNSTVVVETTDMGHADKHSGNDVPFMLAGGGDVIRRGVVNVAGSQYNHQDVLYTAAKACGVEWLHGKEIAGVLTS